MTENKETEVSDLDDSQILSLFWRREEAAISETRARYGAYCRSIAQRILGSEEDAEEVEADTLIGAWNSIPPHRPAVLRTYLGKIARQLALRRLRDNSAEKRGGGECCLALEELEDCVADGHGIDEALEARELARALDRFLSGLSAQERRMFLCRYWYFDPIRDIAARFGVGESKVKMTLLRTRGKLKNYLEKEGIAL